MKLPEFELVRPKTVPEAVAAYIDQEAETGAALLAGGTDLLVRMAQRVSIPRVLVDICAIPGLEGITRTQDGWHIGSATRLATLANAQEVKDGYPIVAEAAESVGATQHRAMGTVGGNICAENRCLYFNQSAWWREARGVCLKVGGQVCHVNRKADRCFSTYSGDMGPVMVALDAKFKVAGPEGEALVKAGDFYTGDGLRPNILKKGEIITGVILPDYMSSYRGSFVKLRPRKAIDFAGVSAAVLVNLQDDQILDARVVLGAVNQAPQRVLSAEEGLRNIKIDRAALKTLYAIARGNACEHSVPDWLSSAGEYALRAAQPMPNSTWKPSYRRKMAGVVVQRAIARVLGGAFSAP